MFTIDEFETSRDTKMLMISVLKSNGIEFVDSKALFTLTVKVPIFVP